MVRYRVRRRAFRTVVVLAVAVGAAHVLGAAQASSLIAGGAQPADRAGASDGGRLSLSGPTPFGGASLAVAASGGHVFLGRGDRLAVLEAGPSDQPLTTLGETPIGAVVTAISVDDSRLWVGDASGSLHVFELDGNGGVRERGSIRLIGDGAVPKAVVGLATDATFVYAKVDGVGLSVVEDGGDALRVRGFLDVWDLDPDFGILRGVLFGTKSGKVVAIDVRAPDAFVLTEPDVRLTSPLIDPIWSREVSWRRLAVLPERREVVAIGGTWLHVFNPCDPCRAVTLDASDPHALRQVGPHGDGIGDVVRLRASGDSVVGVSRACMPSGLCLGCVSLLERGADGSYRSPAGTCSLDIAGPVDAVRLGGRDAILALHTGGYARFRPGQPLSVATFPTGLDIVAAFGGRLVSHDVVGGMRILERDGAGRWESVAAIEPARWLGSEPSTLNATTFALSRDRLAVGVKNEGLRLYDPGGRGILTPTATMAGLDVRALASRDHLLFAVVFDPASGPTFTTIDVSDATHPFVRGRARLEGRPGSLTVAGTTVWAKVQGTGPVGIGGLMAIDVRDPDAPRPGPIVFPEHPLNGLFTSDTRALVWVGPPDDWTVYDLRDGAVPTPIGSFHVTGRPIGVVRDVFFVRDGDVVRALDLERADAWGVDAPSAAVPPPRVPSSPGTYTFLAGDGAGFLTTGGDAGSAWVDVRWSTLPHWLALPYLRR